MKKKVQDAVAESKPIEMIAADIARYAVNVATRGTDMQKARLREAHTMLFGPPKPSKDDLYVRTVEYVQACIWWFNTPFNTYLHDGRVTADTHSQAKRGGASTGHLIAKTPNLINWICEEFDDEYYDQFEGEDEPYGAGAWPSHELFAVFMTWRYLRGIDQGFDRLCVDKVHSRLARARRANGRPWSAVRVCAALALDAGVWGFQLQREQGETEQAALNRLSLRFHNAGQAR